MWRNERPMGASELDWSLARAATVVAALLIAHSLVDYPLRTGAMMAVMAFACALLIEPPISTEHAGGRVVEFVPERIRRPQRRVSVTVHAAATPNPQANRAGALSPNRRWGNDVEWPEEWSETSKAR